MNKPSHTAIATMTVPGDGIQLDGLEQRAQGLENKWSVTPGGPIDGRGAIAAKEKCDTIMTLKRPIGPKGAVTLWVKTDRDYRVGLKAEKAEQQILACPGVLNIGFTARTNNVQFSYKCGEGKAAPGVSLPLPQVPGPAWYQLAVSWDAARGVCDGYLNGSPFKEPGIPVEAWQMATASEVTLTLDRFAIGDLALYDEYVDAAAIRELLPAKYRGTMDRLMGAYAPQPVALEQFKGALIYERALTRQEDVKDWTLEGPGKLAFGEGAMTMQSTQPDGPEGHIVFWPPKDFPADFLAEWDVQIVSPTGLNIVFFCAKGRNGEDIFDPKLEKRNGVFRQYHTGDINCYHISYYASTPDVQGRATSNLRKNHGFFVVSNGPGGIGPNDHDWHKVTLLKRANHLQLAVDGKGIIDFEDDGKTCGPVWGEGKIGLRQMQWTVGRYRNFRVFEVKQ